MKSILFLFLITSLIYGNWFTLGGNSQRTSFLNTIGPESKNDILWEGTINASGGRYIHISDNKLILTRGEDIWSIYRPLVCHDLYSGDILWEKDFPGETRSPTVAIGFKDNVIFASNWQGGSGEDTLYALDADNGNILWKNGIGIHGAPFIGCAFLENGDFLLTIKDWKIARFNSITGDTMWTINHVHPSRPNSCQIAIYNKTAYTWSLEEGVAIAAIDVENGTKKYYLNLPNTYPPSNLLNGTNPVINKDGTIYAHRPNNSLSAIKDDGNQLSILWCDTIRGAGTTSPAIGPDGSVYYVNNCKIMRANPEDGTILDSSMIMFSDSINEPEIHFAIDANGTIFANVSFSQNKLYSFSKDLKLNWTDSVPTIANGGPALSNSGLLAVAGKGDFLRVYKPKNLNTTKKDFHLQNFTVSNRLNSLIFNFDLKNSQYVSLNIFNIKGQLVHKIEKRALPKGVCEVEVKGLTKGQYISKVELGGNSFNKKVTVIR